MPSDTDQAAGLVLASESPLDEPLPPDLQVALGRFLGAGPIETLRAWGLGVRAALGDSPLSITGLCVTSSETPHRGRVHGDGKTHYFACFYDAVILAALTREPVDIRTESPRGDVITATAYGRSDLNVNPPSAVFSFGIDRHIHPPTGDGPSFQDGYAAICPYVKAFPTKNAYHAWAGTVPAPTVAMSLEGATGLAALLTTNSPSSTE